MPTKPPRVGLTAAQAAEVSSANIVGTQTITLKPGYNLIAINWQAIGGEGINIQNLFSADDIAKFTAQKTANRYSADQIKIWDAKNQVYSTFFCRLKADNTYFGWAPLSSASTLASNVFTPGDAMWFYLNGDKDVEVTLKGEVVATAQHVYTFSGDESGAMNMFGNGYPTEFAINDPNIDWIAAGAVAQKTANRYSADQIKIWDPINQVYATYFCRLKADNTYFGWASMSSASTLANVKISAGMGAWYIRNSTEDMNWSYLRPFNP